MEDDGNEEFDDAEYERNEEDEEQEGGDTSGMMTPYTEEGDTEPMQVSNLFLKSGRDDSTYNTSTRDSEFSDDDDEEEDDHVIKNKSGYKKSKQKRKASTNGDMSDTDPEETLLEAKEYKLRLFRRTMILEDVRKAYLRDVVFLKQIMMEMFNDEERVAVMEQYQSMLPSLDMKQAFQPRAPELTTFKVKPCDLCGGHLEITINVSEELQELRSQIEHQKKVEERLRLDHATQSYQFEKLTGEKGYEDRSHAQEKAVLYAEMKRLKGEIDKNNDSSIHHKRQMQQMKQVMAEHEKTKLKLRAAEMKAEDAGDELRTLRQRSHELEGNDINK